MIIMICGEKVLEKLLKRTFAKSDEGRNRQRKNVLCQDTLFAKPTKRIVAPTRESKY